VRFRGAEMGWKTAFPEYESAAEIFDEFALADDRHTLRLLRREPRA